MSDADCKAHPLVLFPGRLMKFTDHESGEVTVGSVTGKRGESGGMLFDRLRMPNREPDGTSFEVKIEGAYLIESLEPGPEPGRNAADELRAALRDGEVVEGIAFGDPESAPWLEALVPAGLRGRVLTLDEAEPLMRGWEFQGGFGGADCFPVWIWTNQRVLWVDEYDGSTALAWMPRHPTDGAPEFSGSPT